MRPFHLHELSYVYCMWLGRILLSILTDPVSGSHEGRRRIERWNLISPRLRRLVILTRYVMVKQESISFSEGGLQRATRAHVFNTVPLAVPQISTLSTIGSNLKRIILERISYIDENTLLYWVFILLFKFKKKSVLRHIGLIQSLVVRKINNFNIVFAKERWSLVELFAANNVLITPSLHLWKEYSLFEEKNLKFIQESFHEKILWENISSLRATQFPLIFS